MNEQNQNSQKIKEATDSEHFDKDYLSFLDSYFPCEEQRRRYKEENPNWNKWGMGNGEWRMENGEWGMENGEWGMENGERTVGNQATVSLKFAKKIKAIALLKNDR